MQKSIDVAASPGRRTLRILFAGERWEGSDALAYERAFTRAGHAVTSIDDANFMPPGWRALWLRGVRRLLMPAIVAEFEQALIKAAARIKPHLFVGFKAPYATPRALQAIKASGAVAINVYPDVSFTSHGRHIPKTLPLYDWVFTTKTFGVADMAKVLGIHTASFIPPAFDPQLHAPTIVDAADATIYAADVSFIGSWSPKKERQMAALIPAHPQARVRIWGASWERALSPVLKGSIQGMPVTGAEYVKAICASRINLALLSEQGQGSSSGDLITHRTFAMPACCGFMLHERTPEVAQYFTEGVECALFGGEDELVDRVRYYLEHEDERARIAEAGRARALACGYSVDARVAEVLAKYRELQSRRAASAKSA